VPGLEPFRLWGTWLNYPIDFPEDVDFEVGQDDPAEDWNYFQPAVRTPGLKDTLRVPYDGTATDWKIRFDADGRLEGEATLTLGIASSVFGSLAVSVNGENVATWESIPGPDNDAALYRHSSRGIYRELSVQFDASLLKPTGNVLNLTPVVPGESDPSAPWSHAFASVMYDAIKLEVAPSLNVEASVVSRCVAGHAVLVTSVRNREFSPMTVVVDTPYGSADHAFVRARTQVKDRFATSLGVLPAGELTVETRAVIDGHEVSSRQTLDYQRRVC
jgi:hypothetical protein